VHVRSRKEEEEEMLIVWHWEKVMQLIHAGDLTNHIQSLQLKLPGKKLTLVVYGAEEYFRSELNLYIKSLWCAFNSVTFIILRTSCYLACMGNGVYWLYESAGSIRKALTETIHKVKTTHFHFTSCLGGFLGI
jgi:hypothetical protein